MVLTKEKEVTNMTIMWNMIIKGWKVINMSGLVVGLFDTYEEAQKFVEKK